jgi:hypothetical protein
LRLPAPDQARGWAPDAEPGRRRFQSSILGRLRQTRSGVLRGSAWTAPQHAGGGPANAVQAGVSERLTLVCRMAHAAVRRRPILGRDLQFRAAPRPRPPHLREPAACRAVRRSAGPRSAPTLAAAARLAPVLHGRHYDGEMPAVPCQREAAIPWMNPRRMLTRAEPTELRCSAAARTSASSDQRAQPKSLRLTVVGKNGLP